MAPRAGEPWPARTRPEQAGEPIGGNDLPIAAQVVSLGHGLVTDHARAFPRIAELPRANWLHAA